MNWAAVAFGELWALLHGQVAWLLGLVAVPTALVFIGSRVPQLRESGLDPYLVLALAGASNTGVRAVFGLRANRLLWARAASQSAGETQTLVGLPARVSEFASWQKGWNVTAALLVGVPVTILIISSWNRIAALPLASMAVLAAWLSPLAVLAFVDLKRARLSSSLNRNTPPV